MLYVFKGKGCADCPFFRYEEDPDSGSKYDQYCVLDGELDGGYTLKIELKGDGKRGKDCPFDHPLSTGVDVQAHE